MVVFGYLQDAHLAIKCVHTESDGGMVYIDKLMTYNYNIRLIGGETRVLNENQFSHEFI